MHSPDGEGEAMVSATMQLNMGSMGRTDNHRANEAERYQINVPPSLNLAMLDREAGAENFGA